MEPVARRGPLLLLLLLLPLLLLAALAQGDPAGDTAGDTRSRSPTPAPAGKRTRNPYQAPKNRKKTIWSYKPGHRSLAFLVAGEVETITSNPKEIEATEEFRCLDCCGAVEMPAGGRITNERMGQSVITMEELERMEIETNSITDRCLGCCDGYGTPLPGHIGYPGGGITTGVTRGRRGPTGRQPSHPPPQRNSPHPCAQRPCRPALSSESDSSSEESPGARRSRAMRHHRTSGQSQNLCRYLGCRSPLGTYGSSSSEED
ncbi:hypothetical protein XENTR_v10015674 [Xenopus tropicalis]|uniref:Uncharacterized protein LOC101732142 n=1 Tax=Xenopus tropicalis TaxID=8364 RepID=A0A8J1JQU0_XENTR|nr:uncharacterized protein LOC101732142 [Xenopus tropicalis]XP_031760253.1 uncharacterized protein LOC101732142 [Xenopus tropicalis]XP_031760254.1 uncharacterized protein LOC101732142 [Xenopus tropicalis]KAE8595280.1 hypothetical protein XENTR_v10015674 [Xenopus tropicalis]